MQNRQPLLQARAGEGCIYGLSDVYLGGGQHWEEGSLKEHFPELQVSVQASLR